MPKAQHIQNSFNSGEMSPLTYGRTDSDRYKTGLATALNYVPTLQGPILRRSGTKFVTQSNNSSQPIFIPFIYSATQNYVLEVGSGYIRFLSNGGIVSNPNTWFQVLSIFSGVVATSTRNTLTPYQNEFIQSSTTQSGGAALTLVAPWTTADNLSLLKWSQDQNSVYIAHPNFPTYVLQIFTTYEWVLKPLLTIDGPYLEGNSYVNPTDGLNVTLALDSNGVLTTGPDYSISALTDATLGSPPAASHMFRVTTSAAHSYVNGQKICISGVLGTGGSTVVNTAGWYFDGAGGTPYWTISVVDNTHFDLIGSTFAAGYSSAGTTFPALFTKNPLALANITNASNIDTDKYRPVGLINSATRVFGTLSTYISQNCYQAVMIPPPGTTFSATGFTTSFWLMGKYWGGQTAAQGTQVPGNYPQCVTFHEQRLGLGGCLFSPQDVDLSQIGNYSNFQPSSPGAIGTVSDTDAINSTLVSTDVNVIRWLASGTQGLLVGSTTTEFSITPSQQGEALSPLAGGFNAAPSSYFGSANAMPASAGNAVLHITRSGRKVRELNFFFQLGTYRSTDMTEINEHLTIPTLVQLATQKETQPLVWAIRSDGALLSMVYSRDDVSLVAGWTRHQLGGQSDAAGSPPIVLSMAVIPSQDNTFDQLYLLVKRWINGSSVYMIEALTKLYDDSFIQEDAFQGDLGSTFDNPKTIIAATNASPCAITSNSHGFSNGAFIKITGVLGLNASTTDINGAVTVASVVNEQTFVVASVTTNTFALNDFKGNAISTSAASAYVSGGQVRKMVTAITGLSYLAGETVGVLADGANHPDCVVSGGGGITLLYPAAKVQIGYRFNSDGQLLRLEAGSAVGTSIGATRRVTRVAVMLHDAGDFAMGMGFKQMLPANLIKSDNQNSDVMVPLFSGIIRDGVESGYDFEGQICFRQSSMLPGVVQAIVAFMEEQDL